MLKRSLLAGFVATVVYGLVLNLLESTGIYTLDLPFLPALSHDYWWVFPVASLASAAVLHLTARVEPGRSRLLAGGLTGAVLAPVVASLCVLLWLCCWSLAAVVGLDEPWKYGFLCLLDQWRMDCLSIARFAAPVAVPTGALMGVMLGWLVRDEPLNDPVTAQS